MGAPSGRFVIAGSGLTVTLFDRLMFVPNIGPSSVDDWPRSIPLAAKKPPCHFVVFAIALMSLRLIIMWVVNNTKRSVLMAILVHASWNTFYAVALVQLFRAPAVLGSYLNLMMAASALAVVLLAATRGRMGYRPEADGACRDSRGAARKVTID